MWKLSASVVVRDPCAVPIDMQARDRPRKLGLVSVEQAFTNNHLVKMTKKRVSKKHDILVKDCQMLPEQFIDSLGSQLSI
jgi:hypothetical protein